jgi:hypothetical protein
VRTISCSFVDKSLLSYNFLVAAARAHQVHRKDMREHMIALLCKPREIESRPQIVALQALGSTVVSITDVVLSRANLKFLDEYCTELGLGNEPVIFQTVAHHKAKKTSILGKGLHPAEVALWWILGKMLYLFFKLTLMHS